MIKQGGTGRNEVGGWGKDLNMKSVSGTFGRLTLPPPKCSEELLDCNQSKACHLKNEWKRRTRAAPLLPREIQSLPWAEAVLSREILLLPLAALDDTNCCVCV